MKIFWLILCLVFLPLALLKASPADLRKIDQQLSENVQIIHSPALSISGLSSGTLMFRNRPHTVLTETQLLQLDKQLRSKNFADAYKNDGCYAKSHLISFELARIGIQHSKALIFGNEVGDIKIIENEKTYPFKFHISPVVLIRKSDGRIAAHVLDLSFADRPIELSAWSDKILKNSKLEKLQRKIVGPEQLDHDWVLSKQHIYSNEILYRFENEVAAFNFILANNKQK